MRAENNPVRVVQHLSLSMLPTFQQIANVCIALHVTVALNSDAMYDEFSSSKFALEHVVLYRQG